MEEVPPPVPPEPMEQALRPAFIHLSEGRIAEAAEFARAVTVEAPGYSDGWLLLAEAEWRLGVAAMERADGTTAELRLLDAREHAAKAVELAPHPREALALRGRILRDSSMFAEAEACLRRAHAQDMLGGRLDGELLYDWAYCGAQVGKFTEALERFGIAESLLGPQARIAVNAAICEEKLGDRPAAVARLRRLYDAEAAAGRGGGADAKWALEKTWDLTVVRRDFAGGRAALAALAAAHPDRPEPPFMLGNLESFLGNHGAAAEAFGRAIAAGSGDAARVRRARALGLAGRGEEAAAAVREAMARDAGFEGLSDAALLAAEALRTGGAAEAGREFLAAATEAWPEDPALLLAAGDAALEAEDLAAAGALYGRALEASPFSGECEARAARARLAAIRAGGGEESGAAAFDAPAEALAPSPGGEALVDFEEPAVFVRGEPSGAARLVEGAMRLEARTGPPPSATAGAAAPGPGADGGWAGRRPARTDFGSLLRVEFFPLLDGEEWESLVFRARTEGGTAAVRVMALDGYDEAGSAFARSRWPAGGDGAAIGAEWTEIVVPLGAMGGFVEGRPLPFLRRKVRAFLLAASGGGAVLFDDLRLRDGAGRERALADFEEAPAEVAVLYGGPCVPFERTLFTEEDVRGFKVPGTVVYAEHIVGEGFDPALVGEGRASLRVHHGEAAAAPAGRFGKVEGTDAGTSSVTVAFQPDRDLLRFKALTFLARGGEGGERLRVVLRDHFDVSGRVGDARRPQSVFPRTAKEDDSILLTREWRLYRIPFDRYPELDREGLASLTFEFPSGTLYLDALGE